MGWQHLTKEERSERGRKGGLRTKERQTAKNPYYYEEIGLKGGNALYAKRGPEFMRKIGSIKKTKQEES